VVLLHYIPQEGVENSIENSYNVSVFHLTHTLNCLQEDAITMRLDVVEDKHTHTHNIDIAKSE